MLGWAWVVAELGHWGHLPQVRGQSYLPYTHAIRVSSPSTVVRGSAISPECGGQLSYCSVQQEAGPAKGGTGSVWPSDFILHRSYSPQRGPQTSGVLSHSEQRDSRASSKLLHHSLVVACSSLF